MLGLVQRVAKKLGLDEAAVAAIGLGERLKRGEYKQLKARYYEYQIRETAEEVGDSLWVGGESYVNSNTVLGENVHLLGLDILGDGRVTIGDNFHAGAGCRILTENHNFDDGDALPYDDSFIQEPVEIGDNVWFGVNVTVLAGVTVEEGAVLQAGSVVVSDIPRGAIAGGHPAEVFDKRDMDHYEKLKAEEKFN